MGGLRSKHPPFSDRKGYPVLQAVSPEQIYSGCRIIHHPKWTKPDSCIYGAKWRINRNAFRPSGRTRKRVRQAVNRICHSPQTDIQSRRQRTKTKKATSFYLNRGFDIVEEMNRSKRQSISDPASFAQWNNRAGSDSSFEIRQIFRHKKRFLDLLLLADEQESMIDLYLERGEMFALYDQNILKTICVVTDEGGKTIELKNIATDPQYQKQGYAKDWSDLSPNIMRGNMTLCLSAQVKVRWPSLSMNRTDSNTRIVSRISLPTIMIILYTKTASN